MATLIVPTDFSENARVALDQALLLAEQTQSEIELLHVIELSNAESPYIAMRALPESKHYEIRLKNLIQQRMQSLGIQEEVKYNMVSLFADTIEAGILARWEQTHAKLIVMGTRGTGRFAGKIFGSQTSALITKAATPVLAVPLEWKPSRFRTLAVCLMPGQIERYAQELMGWAEWLGCELVGLYFTPNPKAHQIEEQYFPFKILQNYRETPVYKDIVAYATNLENGILCMYAQERNFFEKIFDPSVTKRVAQHIDIPLLALPSSF